MTGSSWTILTCCRSASAVGLAMLALALPGLARELPQPSGEPVLTIDGPITTTNVQSKAVFDMSMLQLMPHTTYRTSTVWTDGVHEFEGVSLKALLERVGAGDATSVSAKAINDYAVEIPAEAITAGAPIIAYWIDGTEFPRRAKGPLWVIYPFDSDENFRSEVTYNRSIWQLDRLTVRK